MGGWTIGLFQCSDNIQMFFFAFCLPGGVCCMQALNAKLANNIKNSWKIACLLSCLLPVFGCTINRTRLRKDLDISDSFVIDFAFWLYCPACSATQEYIQTLDIKHNREIKLGIWKLLNRN